MKQTEKINLIDKVIGAISFLYENPEAVSKHALAHDARGHEVLADDPAACRWCGIGRIAYDLGIQPKPFTSDDVTMQHSVRLADTYTEVRKQVLDPLGLDQDMFVFAIDRAPPGGQTVALSRLYEMLVDRREMMFGELS